MIAKSSGEGAPSLPRNLLTAVALALCVVRSAGAADPFPSKPVRVIVPAAPGGALDVTARVIAESMGTVLRAPQVMIVGSDLPVRTFA